MYSVRLIYANGDSAFLRVKNRTKWKTRKTALKHAEDIKAACNKGGPFQGVVFIEVEDQEGHVVKMLDAISEPS